MNIGSRLEPRPGIGPADWRTRRRGLQAVLPALAGAGLALFLGLGGFGLGCLYGQIVGEPLKVVQGVIPVPVVAAAPIPPPGIGGPEEPADLPAAIPALSSARAARFRPPAPGLALFRPVILRPVIGGWVSSQFGKRTDPFTGRPAIHEGMDFAGLDNSVIVAAGPGIVTWSGGQRGYGNLIEIDHGNGYVTRYGHNAFNLVAVGDYVKPGQTIALMGATGRATGTHLHFEVLFRGHQINPARYVQDPI